MKSPLFEWIVPRSLRRNADRTAYGCLEGRVSIVVNFFLFAGKLIIGLLINSIALIADAVHSLSDVATSLIVILGYRISARPADREHPFGHQRAEYVATLIMAVLLVVAGIEFMKSSYGRLINPRLGVVHWGVLVFVFATILIKTWLGGFSAYLGRKIDSAALRADALHHYTDSVSSVLVLIAIFGAKLGYHFLDGAGGMAVGFLLIWAGISIARDAADTLVGKAPTREYIADIRKTCLSVENVHSIHDAVVHSYGDQKFISVHVEVDQENSSLRAHEIATKVEQLLAQRLNAYAIVHVDPVDLHSPTVERLRHLIAEFVRNSSAIREFHDLRVVTGTDRQKVFFDIVPVGEAVSRCEDLDDCQKLIHKIHRYYPQYEVQIHIDQIYAFN
ncbi:MAG: cation diffusion facilitator family transporter [Fidelibacterota bacterium]